MTIRIQEHTAGRVPGPGFYRMPAALYHGDPAPEPSLSASIANMLIDETALHARHCHPRLNPNHQERDFNAAMDKGSVAHEMILGKGAGIAVLDFDDWRTNAAKAARDAARADGLTPVLEKTADEAQAIADAVLTAIQQTEGCDDFFHEAAQSEVVMVWQDIGGVWCRSMIDRLTPHGRVYDIKTSGRGLDDRTLQNKFFDGFDTQPGLYLRGLATLWPEMAGRFEWRWVFGEQTAPFAVRIEEPDAIALKEGEERAELALLKWRRCMATGTWSGYARRIGRIGPTNWAYDRWSERLNLELMEERAAARALAAPTASPDTAIYGEHRLLLPPEAA